MLKSQNSLTLNSMNICKETMMPIKRVTLKRFKALGIPIHRSYIHVNEKPIPFKKFKKFLDAVSKSKKDKDV
jgi:hypothetical protein